jgi:hypothetical protein
VEYAACPGTIAGRFDSTAHRFVNHSFALLMGDMTDSLRLMFRANRQLQVLLTVSPVPLTATASGQHVLTATSHSKSLLRAVASELTQSQVRVDYFPSYEMITHPAYHGRFFAPNLRSVLQDGVDHVMAQFFQDQALAFADTAITDVPADRPLDDTLPPEPPPPVVEQEEEPEPELTEAQELRCEEEVLSAFAPDQRHG